MVGSAVIEACLRSGLSVRALVRPGKPEEEEKLKKRGIEVAIGDVLKAQTLPAAMKEVQVVISCLGNDPKLYIRGHNNLISAADAGEVERVIPSDFSVDFFKLKKGENVNLDMRIKVRSMFAGARVRPIHIMNGAFMDTTLDPQAGFITDDVMEYYGDGMQRCDYTAVADVAKYVAAVCADKEAPEVVRVAGDVLNMQEVAAAVGKGWGRHVNAKCMGSLEELKETIEAKKKEDGDMWDWLRLQYHHNMVSGRGKLEALDNDMYPDIKPMSLQEFAELNKDVSGKTPKLDRARESG